MFEDILEIREGVGREGIKIDSGAVLGAFTWKSSQ